MADFCELNSVEFENSIIKNSFIRSTNGEWIWFIDSAVTCRADIEPILQENDFLSEYDAILFCSEDLDGEIGLFDLLAKPQCEIYAFGMKRQLLIKTGSFNQLLSNGTNYEFLLRAAENGSVYAVSCSAEKKFVFEPYTMAYIMRKYMLLLKESGWLDEVFMRVVQQAEQLGLAEEFNQAMSGFLSGSTEYDKIAANTASCLIFVGDNTCAGVLAGFASSLAEELVDLGQAVITTDGKYGEYDSIPTEKLLNQLYKAIIGFQSSAFAKPMLQGMNGKKVQFEFDDPVFLHVFFANHVKDTYVLCQDGNYADFIKRYFSIPNSVQFPPGGTVIDNLPGEKIYDITFVGNYEPLQECIYEDEFEKGFYEYMITQTDATFEQGMREYLHMQGIVYEDNELLDYLQKTRKVCQNVLHRERHVMIEKIVSSGIKLHVFSENWNMYQGKGRENLVIHPKIYGEEPYRVWAQSKIGLNVMRGHKAGMTERIANIMLCGACCLSDETVYLREHFTDGEDIVLFKRTELDELPGKIRYLLEHDEERERIAAAGCEKAIKEHTWRVRAEQLLELLD